MIIALTGTPGTGKTSISKILEENSYKVVDLNELVCEKDFLIGNDEKRDSKIVDIDKVEEFIRKNYVGNDIVLIEGHISHLLKCADKVIVLRKHPDELRKYLSIRNWNEEKIKENIEAEILDIILCEAVDIHPKENILEINTTGKNIDSLASLILEIIKNKFKNIKEFNIGNIDWSEEILKDF